MPKPLELGQFKEHFLTPGQKAQSDEPVDTEGLKNHRTVRLMAERVAGAADKAERMGLKEEGMNFYPNEESRALDIGTRFNAARAQNGMKLYLPHNHSLAGHLLLGGYSQNNTEANRNAMAEKSAQTGLVLPHLSTPKIEHAIANGIHPLDVFANRKLHDFVGSSLNPETWKGEWGGVKRGSGYVIDRWQHDIAMGEPFGVAGRGMTSGGTGNRRYRVMQAAHEVAHDWYDPAHKLSVPQFQAVSWGGGRGKYD